MKANKPNDAPPQTWLFVWGNVTGIGGTEIRMAEATRELVRRGYRVISFVHGPSRPTAFSRLMVQHGAEVRTSTSWIALLRLVRNVEPTCTLTFGIRPSMAARILRALGVLRSASYMARNGLDFGWNLLVHRFDLLTNRLQDGYLANSVSVAVHLAARGIPSERISVVPGALGEEWQQPAAKRHEGVIVAMVGNNRPEKNQEFGLRAFVESGVDATLRVYTDDGRGLRELISSAAPLAPRKIEFIEGKRVQVEDFDSIDVLLHPSLSESVPRAILEATARGCYVVASDVGDVRTKVDPQASCVLPGHDLLQYAAALRSAVVMVSSPEWSRRLHLTRNTRDYVQDLLDLTPTQSNRDSGGKRNGVGRSCA